MNTSGAMARAAVVLACVIPAASYAQSATNWKFDASLYAFLPTISGTSTFPPSGTSRRASVDIGWILTTSR